MHFTRSAASVSDKFSQKYGFYFNVFWGDAVGVISQMKNLTKYFPNSPIYVVSDSDSRYPRICQKVSTLVDSSKQAVAAGPGAPAETSRVA